MALLTAYVVMGAFVIAGTVVFFIKVPPVLIIDRDSKTDKHSPWEFHHFVFSAFAMFIYIGIEILFPSILFTQTVLKFEDIQRADVTFWFLMLIGTLLRFNHYFILSDSDGGRLPELDVQE